MEKIYYTTGFHIGSELPYFVRWLTPDGLLHEEKQNHVDHHQAFTQAIAVMPDWVMLGPVEFTNRVQNV